MNTTKKTTSTRSKITRILLALEDNEAVNIERVNENSGLATTIVIKNKHTYVPEFQLEWCPVKGHFRVYILVASRDVGKQKAGYPICTISDRLTALDFVQVYMLLHKNRANKKSA